MSETRIWTNTIHFIDQRNRKEAQRNQQTTCQIQMANRFVNASGNSIFKVKNELWNTGDDVNYKIFSAQMESGFELQTTISCLTPRSNFAAWSISINVMTRRDFHSGEDLIYFLKLNELSLRTFVAENNGETGRAVSNTSLIRGVS